MTSTPSIYAGCCPSEVLSSDFLKMGKNQVKASSAQYNNVKIQQSARELGYVPNWGDWNPGDIILVSQEKQDKVARGISQVQKSMGLGSHSIWHHAALHTDRGQIIEATRSGIGLSHISKYVGSRAFLVKRLDMNAKPQITRDHQWKVALKGMEKVGWPYSYRTIFSIWKQSFSKQKTAHYAPSGWQYLNSRICSSFCMEALVLGAGVGFEDFNIYEAMPGDIAMQSQLVTVPLHWIQL